MKDHVDTEALTILYVLAYGTVTMVLDTTILIVNLWLSRLDFTQICEFFLLGNFTNVRVDLSCSLCVHYIVIALIYCFKLSYNLGYVST